MILEDIDIGHLEERILAGEFRSLVHFYSEVYAEAGYRCSEYDLKVLKRSLFPEARTALMALPQQLAGDNRLAAKFPRRSKSSKEERATPRRERHDRYEDASNARLTIHDVLDIRAAYRENPSRGFCPRMARKYGVGRITIFDIVNNNTWKDV